MTNDPVQDQWSMCVKVAIAAFTAGFFWHLASENQKPISRSQHTGTAPLPAAVRENKYALIPPPPPLQPHPTPIFLFTIRKCVLPLALTSQLQQFDGKSHASINCILFVKNAHVSSQRHASFLADNIILSHSQENSQERNRSDFCTKAKTKVLITLSGSNKKSVPLGFTSIIKMQRLSYSSEACIVASFGVYKSSVLSTLL